MVFKNNPCLSHALFTPVYNLAYLKVSYCRQVILFVFFNDSLLFFIVKISGNSDSCRQNKEDDYKMIWNFMKFKLSHFSYTSNAPPSSSLSPFSILSF